MEHPSIQTYPILRLAIPLAIGVFFAGNFPEFLLIGAYIGGILGVFVFLGWLMFGKRYDWRWMFGGGIFLLFFLIGGLRMSHQWRQVNKVWPEEKRIYQGIVQEMPEEKSKTIQCKTTLSDGQNVILYLAKDSFSTTLAMGDRLWLYTQIRPPMNTGYTGTFDYASYLLHKGVSGTSYVPSGSWMESGRSTPLTWKQRALQVRQQIVDKYREWGIGEGQLPVLSALTVGFKGDLSDDVRQTYAVAGIAHVLALSGMHIGFLWMLVSVLLRPLGNALFMRVLRWILATVLLWIFAFIAGLEASVVRAVVMCMLMELGRMAGGKTLSMNTLAIAALFMLLYNPSYLFDVSFQLSFLAVLFILLLYPLLSRACPSQHRWVKAIWNVMAVSIAAQVGTAPLVMYYFHNFSVYFLLANLGVALWVPCIIYTALGTMALSFIPLLQGWGIKLLDGLVAMLNAFASWISQLPGSSLISFHPHLVDVCGAYLLMAIGFWYILTRKRKVILVFMGCMAGWLGLHCCMFL